MITASLSASGRDLIRTGASPLETFNLRLGWTLVELPVDP